MVGGFYRRDLFAAVVGQVRSAVVFVGYIRQVAVAVIRQRAPVAGVVFGGGQIAVRIVRIRYARFIKRHHTVVKIDRIGVFVINEVVNDVFDLQILFGFGDQDRQRGALLVGSVRIEVCQMPGTGSVFVVNAQIDRVVPAVVPRRHRLSRRFGRDGEAGVRAVDLHRLVACAVGRSAARQAEPAVGRVRSVAAGHALARPAAQPLERAAFDHVVPVHGAAGFQLHTVEPRRPGRRHQPAVYPHRRGAAGRGERQLHALPLVCPGDARRAHRRKGGAAVVERCVQACAVRAGRGHIARPHIGRKRIALPGRHGCGLEVAVIRAVRRRADFQRFVAQEVLHRVDGKRRRAVRGRPLAGAFFGAGIQQQVIDVLLARR